MTANADLFWSVLAGAAMLAVVALRDRRTPFALKDFAWSVLFAIWWAAYIYFILLGHETPTSKYLMRLVLRLIVAGFSLYFLVTWSRDLRRDWRDPDALEESFPVSQDGYTIRRAVIAPRTRALFSVALAAAFTLLSTAVLIKFLFASE